MARWDELFDDNNQQINEQRKEACEARIREVQQFLKRSKARQWNVVSVEFGEQLFRDKHFNYHALEKSYSVQDIRDMRGLNYGSYELCYFHHAIVVTPISIRHIDKIKTLTVVPIQTKYRFDSYVLKAQHNRFLEYDSHVLLDSITTIGVERINIDKTKNMGFPNQLALISVVDQKAIKEELKKVLGIN
jgi:hypothetical protein